MLTTKEEWITIQQKIVDATGPTDPWPDNLPKIRKKGDFFILQWDNEQDKIMFLLRWL